MSSERSSSFLPFVIDELESMFIMWAPPAQLLKLQLIEPGHLKI